MLTKKVGLLLLLVSVGLLWAAVAAIGVAAAPPGPPDTATVQFGDADVGSSECQADTGKDGEACGQRGHDESQEANDKLVPRNVTISAGGTVTFLNSSVHQVVILPPGTQPEDVDLAGRTGFAGCPGGLTLYLTDGTALADPICGGGPATVVSQVLTFDTPGKYLVICAFEPHFVGRDMYGWVTVE